ncbi:MAG TPA: aminoglycoside 6-adenylyltransferase [Anaerolineae bacterium]|nr:aminoglycoside 6-adenylyltransferase [Anaerolineae bacterium]
MTQSINMRSEKEMLDLILTYARDHDEVRAVVMNGSRVNPKARKDPFQDYDIVYYVRNVEPFRRNMDVVKYFGEIMILQLPEDMADPPPEGDGQYTYLMQFMDGNRIDLSFCALHQTAVTLTDSLSLVLLDKDNLLGVLPPPSDAGYLPLPPTAKAFDDCCNEFWWLNPYVAKGLWRDELTYAKYNFDTYMREQLLKMLRWYVGVQTGFQKSPGKLGKFLKAHLDAERWALLECTYADAQSDNMWEALISMDDLFRHIAIVVSDHFGFKYPTQDDTRVSAFVRHIRSLPRNAKTIC